MLFGSGDEDRFGWNWHGLGSKVEGKDVELGAGRGSRVQLIKEFGMHHQGDELRLGNNPHMIGEC
jgi:hypothetical protein